MGRRASGGRWGSIPGVGLCRGRPGSGVRRWADLAGANGSSAIVLGNFGGLGRRGMGQGAAIWGGGGRAQLGLENMGVEGVVPRWAELCSPAMVWARAGLGLCPFIAAGGGRGFSGGGTARENANRGSSAGGGAWLRSSAMAVAVASAQMAGARGELRWCQEGAVLGKPGAHEVVWAWGSAPVRPGGRRRRTASPVDEVQGDGGGRNDQWQSRK